MKRSILLCGVISVLTGCAAPGFKMGSASEVADFEVTPITADLIVRQAAIRGRDSAGMAAMPRLIDSDVTANQEVSSLTEQYVTAIGNKINDRWRRSPGSIGESCVVHVRQSIGGYVEKVSIRQCMGDADFERSIEAAVWLANPLPLPPRSEIFENELRFTFRPGAVAHTVIGDRVSPGLAAMAPKGWALPYQYRIGSGDILNITVWDHPELTIPAGEFRSIKEAGHLVTPDGTIFYPYAGAVEVEGRTTSEVRATLTRMISRTIRDPQLDVRVAAFRSQKCYVVGEVGKPGPEPITDVPLTIVDAISQAGRATEEADLAHATLMRDDATYEVNLVDIYRQGDMAGNMLLQDGDVLRIPNRNLRQVYVMGEVLSPRPMPLRDGTLTLAEAISGRGGVSPITSNPQYIYVIRGTARNPKIYNLDSKSPTGFLLAQQFQLEAHDVVYVESAQVSRWSRVVDQLLPTSAILRDTAVTGGL